MKRFFLFFWIIISSYTFGQSITELRGYLPKGEKSLAETQTLIKKSNDAFEKTKLPIYLAFSAVGHFFMAKHSSGVSNKISFFSKGKKLMENAINGDSKNLEIRLMRLISQEKTPRLLFYRGHISEDRKFIKENYQKSRDTELKNYIKSYLKL